MVSAPDLSSRLQSARGRELSFFEALATHDAANLSRLRITTFRRLAKSTYAGKLLFLETLGFNDRNVWHGEPLAGSTAEFSKSYGERLGPRHKVLGALAREGLCPVVLTTNYDLLLEGGYRDVGFEHRDGGPVVTLSADELSRRVKVPELYRDLRG